MAQICVVSEPGPALEVCKQFFIEYASELNADLRFQQFDSELSDPLEKYGSPSGLLLLAYADGTPAGTVAYKTISPGTCEMKRLYVQPRYRSLGIGSLLVDALLEHARQAGFTNMVLDTLERLQPAINLYRRHGFTATTAYYHNPLQGVVYMKKHL